MQSIEHYLLIDKVITILISLQVDLRPRPRPRKAPKHLLQTCLNEGQVQSKGRDDQQCPCYILTLGLESKHSSIPHEQLADSLGDQVIVFSLELDLKENDPAGDMNTTGEFNTP